MYGFDQGGISAEPSKLVLIACEKNPHRSFCDDEVFKIIARKRLFHRVASVNTHSNSPKPIWAQDWSPEKTEFKRRDDPFEIQNRSISDPSRSFSSKDSGSSIELVNLPTEFGNITLGSSSTKNENSSAEELLPELPPRSENFKNSSEILIPDKSNESNEKEQSEFGSLLRLPKPKNSHIRFSSEPEVMPGVLILPPQVPETTTHPAIPFEMVLGEDGKTEPFVAVFITKFCVDRRRDFISKCRGKVEEENLEFCRAYPLACQAEDEVIPVLTYCQRYQEHFKRYCDSEGSRDRHLKNFCKAYSQFCIQKSEPEEPTSTPKYRLRRCNDVQDEARKLCNPLPPSTQRLDSKKCADFLRFCSKYVDWL
uniref:Uncharacterized protein n=1 Tax=Acrobeloides nanus TaxID=290746 RepID=A0A914DWD5_9BILA